MYKKNVILSVFLAMFISLPLSAATVAHWTFEDGVPGEPFTDSEAGEADGSGGSVDLIGGYLMRGWSDYYGPYFSDNTPWGSFVAMSNADNHQDGYCTDEAITGWSPSVWTIECSILLEEIDGWETFIGRDGSTNGDTEADFYFSNNGEDDRFRINVETITSERWILDGDYTVETNKWYNILAMSDGVSLSMWLDDGAGYQQIGKMDISSQSIADNALAVNNFTWTFGRGWFNGDYVDHIDGGMDNIRFMDTAIVPASGGFASSLNNDGSVGTLQQDETVNLELNFKAAVDPNDAVESTLLKHYIYLSSGTDTDPNLVLYATVDHTDYNDSSVTYSINGLTNGSTYYWAVEEGFDSGNGTAYPAGNSNNITSVTWEFTTIGLTPSIVSGPDDAIAKPDATFSVQGSPVAETFQWFKVDEAGDIMLTDDAVFSGTASTDLTVTGATLAEEGQYYCIAYNGQTPSAPSRAAYLWTSRLIGHWKFDDNLADSVTDIVAGVPVHDGEVIISSAATAADGAVSYEAGIDGNAVSFNNDGDIVQIPNSEYFNFFPGDMTVSIWYKVNEAKGWLLPISKLDGQVSGWLIGTNNESTANAAFILEVPNNWLDGRSEVDTGDGQWHMLTLTYDAESETMTAYTDGERDAYATGVVIAPDLVPAAPLYIGGFESQLSINGAIDDVRIYSYDFTATEVAALYNEMKPDEYVCLATLEDSLVHDLNDDCRITVADFAIFAQDWLVCERYPGDSCEW